jgi:cysteine desulfurase/selenocysteine lyase
MMNLASFRSDFPVIAEKRDQPLVYLDNAATKQKPQAVIDAMTRFYEHDYATVHRGVYAMSMDATARYDAARTAVASYLNAGSPKEIVFVRGATEAINLVAQSWGRKNLKPGREVLVSEIEHHANLLPWQAVCAETGAKLVPIPVDDAGDLDMDAYRRLLSPRTAMVAVSHVSNTIGTVLPVEEITRLAKEQGALVLIDGAQAVAHATVDVRYIGCDFYCGSGHKLYGPTGIGFLYGRYELLEAMPPYQLGGSMIETVSFEKTTFLAPPERFEAGTPAFVEAIGLHAAIDYVKHADLLDIASWENALLRYTVERLKEMKGVRIIGYPKRQASVVSFVMDGIHPHDIGTILDSKGICIRVGHHCSQTTMRRFGIPATARASFALYNSREDADALLKGLDEVKRVMR